MSLFDPPPDELEWSPPSLRTPHGQWWTKDGRMLPIAGMKTDHLRNAIALFAKFGYGDHVKLDELRDELARRESDHEGRYQRE